MKTRTNEEVNEYMNFLYRISKKKLVQQLIVDEEARKIFRQSYEKDRNGLVDKLLLEEENEDLDWMDRSTAVIELTLLYKYYVDELNEENKELHKMVIKLAKNKANNNIF